jgi:RND family efflux transporter MFP subunit
MAILKKIINWLIILAILAALGYQGYRYWTAHKEAKKQLEASAATSSGPTPMPVAKCTLKDITDSINFTGTTEAVNTVEIRARVAGYLKDIHFTDGSIVAKGQLLFTIEPDMYKSICDEAQARLQSAQTELTRAKLDFERIQKAVQSGSVSKQELTGAQAAFETAQSAVMGYQASLDKAKLDLSYTEIRSPIDGRIGRRLADAGNLVGAGEQTLLTTVRQIQPMYVFFNISEHLLEGDFLSRLQGKEGSEQIKFSVGLPNQDSYPYSGTINYLDNIVNTNTGTIYVRGQIDNSSAQLMPGMYVMVKIPTTERPNAVLIPEMAINTDLGGKFLLAVGKDNILERRPLKLGATIGDMRVVTEGLDGSETFIVGGFHIARPGMPIIPVSPDAAASPQQAAPKN